MQRVARTRQWTIYIDFVPQDDSEMFIATCEEERGLFLHDTDPYELMRMVPDAIELLNKAKDTPND